MRGWYSRLNGFDELKRSKHLTSHRDVKAYMKHPCGDDDKKVTFSSHICSPAYLLQPALTRASRQVREEALTVFYRCNRSDLEVSNFFMLEHHGILRSHMDITRMPIDWWRSIGDTNLRALRKLDDTHFWNDRSGEGDML